MFGKHQHHGTVSSTSRATASTASRTSGAMVLARSCAWLLAVGAVAAPAAATAAEAAVVAQASPVTVGAPSASETKRYEVDCTLKFSGTHLQTRERLVDLPHGTTVNESPSNGDACISVISGAVDVRPSISRRVHVAAGGSLLIAPGERYTLANVGETPARVLVTDLVPPGGARVAGPLSVPSAPPTIARTMTFAGGNAVGNTYRVFHRIITLPPHAKPRVYRFNGQAVNSVVAGTVSLNRGGTVAEIRSGEAWSDQNGDQLTLANNGRQPARIFTSVVVPVGPRPSAR